MKKAVLLIIVFGILVGGGVFIYINMPDPPLETKFVQQVRNQEIIDNEQGHFEPDELQATFKQPGDFALLTNPKHTYQTFNNCGPATLSMILSWFGVDATQKELGDKMRPYQHPKGDNDDKTIFTYEFVGWAQEYGLSAFRGVNGDIELLKTFTANGIPVVVKTWLNVNDDIGHFRVVRGFDQQRQVIIQDDSYHGKDKRISYFDFLSMWQPFNYDYVVVYPKDMEDTVMAILGDEVDQQVAWQHALTRAQEEQKLDPENPYPGFNISTSAYHLNDYQQSASAYESVEDRLPRRMLWYQIEPIQAYQQLGNYERVFAIIDRGVN